MAAIIRVLGLALAVHAARSDTCDGTCDAGTINGSAACGLELLPWDGSFGATVATPMRDIVDAPCLHDAVRAAFAAHRLLRWSGEALAPDDELAFMKLLPHDGSPGAAHGPRGVAGVDAEKYARWRVPARDEILLQGEGFVPAGHHGVPEGHLSSGKPIKEWHTDGHYEAREPSIATSMYCVSVKPVGGDTLFMDARVIYDELDDAERGVFDCADIEYSRSPVSMHSSGYRALLAGESAASNVGSLYAEGAGRARAPGATHPAVWVLPDGDGRRSLPLAPMWIDKLNINGTTLAGDELQLLVAKVLARGERSLKTYAWTPGDFVVWDNRALLHSATPNDGFSPEGLRLLHRIRLAGNLAPVGPDTCAR